METTQLVLSQFKNFFIAVNGELNKVSPAINNECCELMTVGYVILIVAVRVFLRHCISGVLPI